MKKETVKIGKHYLVKRRGRWTRVKILSTHPAGGWWGLIGQARRVHIESAGELRAAPKVAPKAEPTAPTETASETPAEEEENFEPGASCAITDRDGAATDRRLQRLRLKSIQVHTGDLAIAPPDPTRR